MKALALRTYFVAAWICAVITLAPQARVAFSQEHPSKLGVPSNESLRDVVPTLLVTVRTGGLWERGSARGQYRAIVVAKPGFPVYHQLYLQWIEIDRRGVPRKIIDERKVSEVTPVTRERGEIVTHLKFRKHEGNWRLSISTSITTKKFLFDDRYAPLASERAIKVDSVGMFNVSVDGKCSTHLKLGPPGEYRRGYEYCS